MENKEIYIDGVDVSGCEFYKNTNFKNCYSRDYKESVCQSNHNCHYKNWQRKEQECDMWKNLTVDNGAVALKYQQQLDQLKEQLEAYKMEAEEGKEINAELKAENDELKKQLKPLQDKYFKGLDTIAIAGLAKLILQKISECEE